MIFLFSIIISLTGLIIFNYGKHMLTGGKNTVTRSVLVERGSILDRNGKLLAVQTTLYNIGISRASITDKELCAGILAPLTGLSQETILNRLSEDSTNFFYLKKKVSEGEKTAIEEALSEAKIRGVRLEPVISRTYPEGALASHVIGFMGDDGNGLSGIEYSYQDTLSPPINTTLSNTAGSNIMLTIDANIQYDLEKIARQTMQETSAEGIILIAAEGRTGEILAYVSEPSANLNDFVNSSDAERYDRAALYAYEPGSVFKIFSVSALLDMGLVSETDRFYCDGHYTLTTARGETINIKCLDAHGWVTPRDVIRLSCNEGSAQMSERVSAQDFENRLRAFGFGSKTGVQIPGESAGIFRPSSSWSLRSKPTIAIGQELSVSALQMVEAATALTNKGTTLRLTLLSRLFSRDGLPLFAHQPTALNRVISSATAEAMLSFMQSTSESGTGTRAAVGDVPMAVKTGTAQMLSRDRSGYSTTDFISSCIGIFPADDPQIILYTAIIKPVGETYGGRIAAPVVSKAANVIIDYRGFGRSGATSVSHSGLITVPKNQPVVLSGTMPDLTGVSKKMLTALLGRSDLNIIITGDGYVTAQKPPAGTALTQGMTIELRLE